MWSHNKSPETEHGAPNKPTEQISTTVIIAKSIILRKFTQVQKIVLRIILGNRYVNYDQACMDVNLSTLEQRRIEICLNFGIKCLRHPHHKTLFPSAIENGHYIRSPAVIQQTTCRTTRYQKSPVPYISKLLDDHFTNEREMLETESVHGMN